MYIFTYHAFSPFLRGEYVGYNSSRYTDIPLTEPPNDPGDDEQSKVVGDSPEGIGGSHTHL